MPAPTAYAPFNFVPSSDPIPWPIHDGKGAPTYSGSIAVRMTALEPLLVAGEQKDNAPRTFFQRDGKFYIPASSIKGVVRNMVEALSISALAHLTPRSVFFRDLNNASYLDRFVDRVTNVGVSMYRSRAGYLRKREGQWEILPCEWAKVSYRTLSDAEVSYQDGGGRPHERVQALLRDRNALRGIGGTIPDLVDHIHHPHGQRNPITLRYRRLTKVTLGGGGRLVTAGHMKTRHFESVFYPPDALTRPINVQHLWDDFQEWMQQHKPRAELFRVLQSAQAKSYYEHGVPVFWIEAANSTRGVPAVRAFGFCQLFSVPYRCSVLDLTEARDERDPVSLAERIFGFTSLRVDGIPVSRKGRVAFGAARCTKPTVELPPRSVIPGNPSASCLGLYLEQPAAGGIHRTPANHGLHTFDQTDSRLRGRKFYWHRPRGWDQLPPATGGNDHVRALYAPIDRGAEFESVIHFERLNNVELGALLAAIQLPRGHAHKIGLGKPFGLGSVRLEITRFGLGEDAARYRSLKCRGATSDSPLTGVAKFTEAFEQCIAQLCRVQSFEELVEVQALRALTNYDNSPQISATQYMPLQRPRNDDRDAVCYVNKPVLPTAAEVARANRR
jgi:CRISPR-associated protein (TIGR03986 family)